VAEAAEQIHLAQVARMEAQIRAAEAAAVASFHPIPEPQEATEAPVWSFSATQTL